MTRATNTLKASPRSSTRKSAKRPAAALVARRDVVRSRESPSRSPKPRGRAGVAQALRVATPARSVRGCRARSRARRGMPVIAWRAGRPAPWIDPRCIPEPSAHRAGQRVRPGHPPARQRLASRRRGAARRSGERRGHRPTGLASGCRHRWSDGARAQERRPQGTGRVSLSRQNSSGPLRLTRPHRRQAK